MTVHMVTQPIEAPAATHPRPPRRFLGLSSGQIVAAQLALLGLLVASQWGVLGVVVACPIAAVMLILGWGRMRGRWLSEWLSVAMRYRGRERRLDGAGSANSLLTFAHPGSRLSTVDVANLPTAVVTDGDGLAAMLELGETAVVPLQSWYPLPSPASLLPAPAVDTPPVRVQLILHAVATGSATPPGGSYRQLTGGRLLAGERAVLAVRVQRAEGWTEADMERALTGAIRKIRTRLADIPHRPLGEVAALRTLSEFTSHDGAQSAQEGWSALHIGGLQQATYAVDRWPHPQHDPQHALLPRLLRLPASTVTVALTAGPWRGAHDDHLRARLTVRLGAPDANSLSSAAAALKQLLAGERAHVRRLDGEHIDGLLSTLPLADPTPPGVTFEAHAADFRRFAEVAPLITPYGGSGLMIGVNRHNEPVSFRLFRPETTRAVLIGGVAVAQVIAVRAMALGGHVLVQTTRPWAWEAFTRGLGQGAALTVMAPGPVTVPPGTPLRSLLSIVDAGPVAADRSPGTPWHSTLVVRDDLSAVDVDVLGRADVALLQPLRPAEAAVAVSVLGLSRDQEAWLARAQPGMIGVVHRRSVRWAAIAQTPYEQQLIGALARQS